MIQCQRGCFCQNIILPYLTVRNIKGDLIERRTRVSAINDMVALDKFGLTDSGYMEAEGVKIIRGVLYLGYANKNLANKRYATILQYKPCMKSTPW